MSKLKEAMNERIWKSEVEEDTYLIRKDMVFLLVNAIIGHLAILCGIYYGFCKLVDFIFEKIKEYRNKKYSENLEK